MNNLVESVKLILPFQLTLRRLCSLRVVGDDGNAKLIATADGHFLTDLPALPIPPPLPLWYLKSH